MSFTSGAKGGVGKSTIVANMAALFDVPIAIIDLGIDGSTTASILHKVSTDSSQPGVLDFLIFGRDFELLESKMCKNVYIVPPGTIRGVKLPLLVVMAREFLKNRLEKLLLKLYNAGVQVVLVDLPANAELLHVLYVLFLYVSDIINIVCDPSLTSLETVHRWWQVFSHYISKSSQVVNIVVNKWLPCLDGGVIDNLSRFTINGTVFKIPYDVATHILTARSELAVLYREADKFTRALMQMYKSLGSQLLKYVGVPRFKV